MNQKYLRSFGRIKGHKLSQSQEILISEFLPKIRPSVDKLSKRIWFEIGFGGGEHIIQLIGHRSDEKVSIIGCEPYINGSVKAIKYIYDNHCENVFIHDSDAREFLEKLGNKSVEKFFILFPDPWPKKRHYKRRIISQSMIELLISKLTDSGYITIATDHIGYAEWISEILKAYNYKHEFLQSYEDCTKEGILTRYCSKALARGGKINLFKISLYPRIF